MSRIARTRLPMVLILLTQVAVLSSLFASQDVRHSAVGMRVAGSEIQINLPDEQLKIAPQDLLDWVKSAAVAVAQYYGRFPVPHLTIRIRAGRRGRIGHGVTYPEGGGLITVAVGREAEIGALKDDWVMTHEMIHLAFPSMPENHHWIEEGISTYVEPVARARAGQIPEAEVWKQFILEMPKGEPAPGDQGLDNTPTWGRTYWGGAMFCLVADVQIRERTHNRKGLQDSLRAILDHGGVITEDWDIERALAIGDQASGTDVLQSVYKAMRDKPVPVDLDHLWQKLGLALNNGEIIFNDNAEDAPVRKAIISHD